MNFVYNIVGYNIFIIVKCEDNFCTDTAQIINRTFFDIKYVSNPTKLKINFRALSSYFHFCHISQKYIHKLFDIFFTLDFVVFCYHTMCIVINSIFYKTLLFLNNFSISNLIYNKI